MNRRRGPQRRGQHGRRQTPRRAADSSYTTLVQRVILAFGAVGVIYGQAEMLGEPWRHILAVGCVIVLVVIAVWMKKT